MRPKTSTVGAQSFSEGGHIYNLVCFTEKLYAVKTRIGLDGNRICGKTSKGIPWGLKWLE